MAEDMRRTHLIAILERLAAVQHQVAEVADLCRMYGTYSTPSDAAAAMLLSQAANRIDDARYLVQTAIDTNMIPAAPAPAGEE